MKDTSNSSEGTISYVPTLDAVAAPAAYIQLNRGTGPILATPELVSLYWGGFAQSEIDGMQAYLNGFAGYLSGQGAPAGQEPDVQQYGVTGATVGNSYVLNTTPAGAVSDTDLQNQIISLQNQGLLPAFSNNRIFLIFTKGISFSIILEGGGYGQTWCGFHEQWGDGQYYGLCPYPEAGSGCVSGDSISSWQSVASHEIMEAATDPKPFTGWTPEGGDQCAWQEVALSFGTVQKFADNQQQTCSIWIPRQWVQIGGPADQLYTTGQNLYATTPGTGDIYQYNGTPMQWTMIGGPGSMFAGNADTLYGLTPDKSAVWQYSGAPNNWFQIGGPAGAIIAGGASLYATTPDSGAVYQY